MYSGQELSECFASLHMTFDNDVQKIRNEVSKNYELMEVLHSNALLTNDDLQNIHNKIIPDLEDKISDEAKERIKIELRGWKWNLVIWGRRSEGGGCMEIWKTNLMSGFVHSVLKMSSEEVNSVLPQSCHILPGGVKNERRVIFRLSSLLVRDEILTYAMGLRRGSIYRVVTNVSPSMSIFRCKLLKKGRKWTLQNKHGSNWCIWRSSRSLTWAKLQKNLLTLINNKNTFCYPGVLLIHLFSFVALIDSNSLRVHTLFSTVNLYVFVFMFITRSPISSLVVSIFC